MKRFFLVLLLQLLIAACGQQSSSTSDYASPEASSNMAPAPMAPEARGMAKLSADIEQSGAEQSLTELSEPRLSEPKLSEPTKDGHSNALKKYIALRHHLQIKTSSEQMQASFDAALKHCEALSCELLSANYNKETPYNPPSASLNAQSHPEM